MVGWGAPWDMTSSLLEVIAVFGPTASGKTAVSEIVAIKLGTEVVSADAMQVYSGLPILTNQPESPTRLVAIRSLSHEFSVGEYAKLAHEEVDELVRTNGVAVVSGGTGLYLRAALVDLELPPAVETGARARWEALYDGDPNAAHMRLQDLDPAAAAIVHRNDRRRVVRALELAEGGGSLVPAHDRLWSTETRRPTLVVGLEVPPDRLAKRIRTRTEAMFARGVIGEVRQALVGEISKTAEKALGLRELTELPPELAREQLIARTQRYAAYQRKWMRRIGSIVMIEGDRPVEEVADEILGLVRAR
ncbi:MAG: tRNA dimethylallyltransferase [Thermoleophilia bacterium]|nr:tRNA dimethylallyltransferase [Thermoleophilia bacterium]